MIDEQKAITEMAILLFNCDACITWPCENCILAKDEACSHRNDALRLVNAGYGNIRQALTEFAERIKMKIERKTDNVYKDFATGRYESITFLVDKVLKETLLEI
ncbi:MAG: hypothetical protein J1E81_05950 [Eubacterium sp.]|nr:hypothetical protein [Eubacterium sp.]